MFGLFQHFNYYDSEAVKEGTSRVPYRISEATVGPGLIYRFLKLVTLGAWSSASSRRHTARRLAERLL